MDKEELKQKLMGTWVAQKAYEAELEALQRARSRSMKSTPAYLPAAGDSGNGGTLENSVVKNLEQEQRTQKACDELVRKLAEFDELVTLLPNGREKIVVIRRYRNYKSWQKIADELGYKSSRGAEKAHDRALKIILRKYNAVR